MYTFHFQSLGNGRSLYLHHPKTNADGSRLFAQEWPYSSYFCFNCSLGDVKAGNLLVDDDGTVRLADFGVSSSLVDTGIRKGTRKTFVGTPCWMAPGIFDSCLIRSHGTYLFIYLN